MIEYKVTKHKTDKATVTIRKPILTDDERKAREEEIKKSLIQFYKERMKVNAHS